jgi:hypothetical protein
LDINAGVKKLAGDDDDFDYIYHLPFTPPERILYRDPFKQTKLPLKNSSINDLSRSSRHSIKEIRGMLNPILMDSRTQRKRTTKSNRGSQNSSQYFNHSALQSKHSLLTTQEDGLQRGLVMKQQLSQPKELDIGEDYLELIKVPVATFRAMPEWVYKYVSPNSVAMLGFLAMIVMVGQVIISSIIGK